MVDPYVTLSSDGDGVSVLILPPVSCVTLGKSLSLSEPWFPDLEMGVSVVPFPQSCGWKELWAM